MINLKRFRGLWILRCSALDLEGSKNPYFDFSSSSNINGLRFSHRRKKRVFRTLHMHVSTRKCRQILPRRNRRANIRAAALAVRHRPEIQRFPRQKCGGPFRRQGGPGRLQVSPQSRKCRVPASRNRRAVTSFRLSMNDQINYTQKIGHSHFISFNHKSFFNFPIMPCLFQT